MLSCSLLKPSSTPGNLMHPCRRGRPASGSHMLPTHPRKRGGKESKGGTQSCQGWSLWKGELGVFCVWWFFFKKKDLS